jgi:hypothetical protein
VLDFNESKDVVIAKQQSFNYEYLTPENLKETLDGIFDVMKPLRALVRANELEAFERSNAADLESPDVSGAYDVHLLLLCSYLIFVNRF